MDYDNIGAPKMHYDFRCTIKLFVFKYCSAHIHRASHFAMAKFVTHSTLIWFWVFIVKFMAFLLHCSTYSYCSYNYCDINSFHFSQYCKKQREMSTISIAIQKEHQERSKELIPKMKKRKWWKSIVSKIVRQLDIFLRGNHFAKPVLKSFF